MIALTDHIVIAHITIPLTIVGITVQIIFQITEMILEFTTPNTEIVTRALSIPQITHPITLALGNLLSRKERVNWHTHGILN